MDCHCGCCYLTQVGHGFHPSIPYRNRGGIFPRLGNPTQLGSREQGPSNPTCTALSLASAYGNFTPCRRHTRGRLRLLGVRRAADCLRGGRFSGSTLQHAAPNTAAPRASSGKHHAMKQRQTMPWRDFRLFYSNGVGVGSTMRGARPICPPFIRSLVSSWIHMTDLAALGASPEACSVDTRQADQVNTYYTIHVLKKSPQDMFESPWPSALSTRDLTGALMIPTVYQVLARPWT